MSDYLSTYETPRACYRKAPVRRETNHEGMSRRLSQLPSVRAIASLLMAEKADRLPEYLSINKGLIPGKARYIKVITTPTPDHIVKGAPNF